MESLKISKVSKIPATLCHRPLRCYSSLSRPPKKAVNLSTPSCFFQSSELALRRQSSWVRVDNIVSSLAVICGH